jgi:hypothetical protein
MEVLLVVEQVKIEFERVLNSEREQKQELGLMILVLE